MTEHEFLRAMEELLEVDSGMLKPSDRLEDTNWDSLAVLGLISMVDQKLGIQLQPAAIGRCVTVDDLYAMVMTRAA